jgi:hypothetical protein
MTPEQKYLFDLQGYVVLPDVLPQDYVAECDRILQGLEAMAPEQYPEGVVQSKPRTNSELYLSNVLQADPLLHRLIDVPEVIDVVRDVSLGLFRLNHAYSISHWGEGYTFLHMGGTPVHPKAAYICQNGRIFSLLTKAVFPIRNHEVGDGCFAVIPGSHKANFARPWGNHPSENPPLVPLPAKPGDAIVFCEAMAHGSVVNTSGRTRRTMYCCYSVGYMPDWTKLHLSFSPSFMDQLSPERREIVRLKID